MDRNFRRLLDTLAVIPSNGKKLSTPQILERLKARGHKVDIRTVQRDLESLEKTFGLERDDRGKPHGWGSPKQAIRISLPEMDWSEALSFYLLKQYLQDLLPTSVQEHLAPHFQQAEQKLKSQFPDLPLKHWPEKVRVVPPNQPMRSPKVNRAVRDVVTEALLSGRQAEIQYRRKDGDEPKPWRIHPLGMIQHGRVFYLAVRINDYENVRMIALHRITRAKLLEAKVRAPADFSLDRWLQEGAMGFGGGGMIRLIADFHNKVGYHLVETPLSEDQTVTPLDKTGVTMRVTATVLNTEQLRRWLLGFGSAVEIIEPVSLRNDLAETLRNAANLYEKSE
ncbi:MAG: helix-turn-helix transcriptional regulator [Burkholderiales bacterium]